MPTARDITDLLSHQLGTPVADHAAALAREGIIPDGSSTLDIEDAITLAVNAYARKAVEFVEGERKELK